MLMHWFRAGLAFWVSLLITPLCTAALLVSAEVHGLLQQSQKQLAEGNAVAAVSLLAEEAGARFTDFRGRRILPFPDFDGDRHYPSITAPTGIHRTLVRLLREVAP
jgi:fructose-1,6-bisphosphatase/inositol monophosphatase family enzyme